MGIKLPTIQLGLEISREREGGVHIILVTTNGEGEATVDDSCSTTLRLW
jgi:hypothetical protein